MLALALLALAARPVPVLSIDLFFDVMSSCSQALWYAPVHVSFSGNAMCPSVLIGGRDPWAQCAMMLGDEHYVAMGWQDGAPSITSRNIAISDSAGTQLTLEYQMVVANLEGDEACYVEYSLDGGQTFTTLASYGEADQEQVIQQNQQLPLSDTADADEITLRFRLSEAEGKADCYVDNVAVDALLRPAPPTSDSAAALSSSRSRSCTASSSAAFQVLSGGGSVLRSYLTYDQLTQASFPWAGPVDYRAMAIVPGNAAQPVEFEFAFEGVFELDDVNLYADFEVLVDTYEYSQDAQRLTLPPISAELVQHGSYLLPADRALRRSTHPYWDYLLGVGRVWHEDGDHGMLRAALPFSLTQKNSNENAVHSGVLMFLFDATSISNVWYQITSETDIDYKVNMFGAVTASYTPSTVAAKCDIIDAYATEVTNGVAVEPMAERRRELEEGEGEGEGEGAERGVDTALIAITTDQALAIAVALLICVNVCVAMEIMRRRAGAGTWCKKTSYANVQWGAEDSEAVMQS